MIAGLHGRYRCPKGAATVPGGFVILLPLYNAIYSCSQFFKTDPYKAAPFLKPRPRINSILTPDMSSWASASSCKLKTKIGEGGRGIGIAVIFQLEPLPFTLGHLRPGRAGFSRGSSHLSHAAPLPPALPGWAINTPRLLRSQCVLTVQV